MVAAGYLRGVPLDPARRPYRLLPDGRVSLQVPEDFPFITRGLEEPSKPGQGESK
jgi:hypothetical protein